MFEHHGVDLAVHGLRAFDGPVEQPGGIDFASQDEIREPKAVILVQRVHSPGSRSRRAHRRHDRLSPPRLIAQGVQGTNSVVTALCDDDWLAANASHLATAPPPPLNSPLKHGLPSPQAPPLGRPVCLVGRPVTRLDSGHHGDREGGQRRWVRRPSAPADIGHCRGHHRHERHIRTER